MGDLSHFELLDHTEVDRWSDFMINIGGENGNACFALAECYVGNTLEAVRGIGFPEWAPSKHRRNPSGRILGVFSENVILRIGAGCPAVNGILVTLPPAETVWISIDTKTKIRIDHCCLYVCTLSPKTGPAEGASFLGS